MTGEMLRRDVQYFAGWGWFAPHRDAGIGWSTLLLAAGALVLPPAPAAGGRQMGDRAIAWWIALGALVAACAATGPNQPMGAPNLYELLARFLPGLDAVRVPARVDTGYHLGLCLLAGLGVATLVQRAQRYRTGVAVAILTVVVVETWVLVEPVRPTAARGSLISVAPPAEDLEMFETLSRMGNAGPLLELPIGDADREYLFRSPRRILLSAHHRRRTSACYGSFLPPGRDQLRRDTLLLPNRAAVERMCQLGFTTAVVHLDTPLGRYMAERFHESSFLPEGGVRQLASSPAMTAFSLCGEEHGR
jgi:hypothetical protein